MKLDNDPYMSRFRTKRSQRTILTVAALFLCAALQSSAVVWARSEEDSYWEPTRGVRSTDGVYESISGRSVVIHDESNHRQSYAFDPQSSTVWNGTQQIAPSELQSGQRVRVRYSQESNGEVVKTIERY